MSMTMHIHIVSAETEIFSSTVTEVYAPAEMGEVGIYPRHTPLLTRLKPGEVRTVDLEGKMRSFYVSGGILEVQPHVVTILSDTAVRAADLDEAAALEAKARAEASLADKKSDMDYAHAKTELLEALAQLDTIKKLKKRK
ncbi:MAG: F0F1 ATP synthase subunit epsilon [Gammaproteobacteria bacterium]